MRLFIGIYPPQQAIQHLSATVGQLRIGAAAASGTSVGLIPTSRWHLTVAFLGELDPKAANQATAALSDGVARWRGDGGQCPRLRLSGGGRFGRRRFTVLWVGVAGDVPQLRELSTRVRRALQHHRVPYDSKPLRPHLTIARPGQRLAAADLAADLDALHAYHGPRWPIVDVHLLRSYPGPRPVHESLAAVPLS